MSDPAAMRLLYVVCDTEYRSCHCSDMSIAKQYYCTATSQHYVYAPELQGDVHVPFTAVLRQLAGKPLVLSGASPLGRTGTLAHTATR